MKIFVVLAHPEPKSFNAAMYRTTIDTLIKSGHDLRYTDLYSEKFNPVSDRSNFISVNDASYFKQQLEELHASDVNGFAFDIDKEQQKLEWCDLMIWQFPLWWFGLPAILKGWVDRVFAMGRIYGQGKIYENGVFSGKRALLSLTTGGEPAAYQKGGFNGDLAGILRPIQRGIFEFTGFSVLAPHVVYGPVRKSTNELNGELKRWSDRLINIDSEQMIPVGGY